MTPEELDQLLGATTWFDFEKTTYGSIDIYFKGQLSYPVCFTLRTGLYFGKPVQVIMALGQFVRMRASNIDPEDFILEELDPNKPGILVPRRRWSFTTGMNIGWAGNMVVSNRVLNGIITT